MCVCMCRDGCGGKKESRFLMIFGCIARSFRYNHIAINIAWGKCVIQCGPVAAPFIFEMKIHSTRTRHTLHPLRHTNVATDRTNNFLCYRFLSGTGIEAIRRLSVRETYWHTFGRQWCKLQSLQTAFDCRLPPKAQINTWENWKNKIKHLSTWECLVAISFRVLLACIVAGSI